MNYKWLLVVAMLLISACSSKIDRIRDQISDEVSSIERKLSNLENALKSGNVLNAVILTDYANRLNQSKPEYKQLVNALAKNATTEGALYSSLKERLIDIKASDAVDERSLLKNLEEAVYIGEAANVATFNDALSDPVNVLADLSNGELPRVQSVDKTAERRINRSGNYGVGSQLIGNPNYGHWVTDSNGLSFWEWYAVFSLLDDVSDFGRKKKRRYYYNSWARTRPYSYYHDYGRYRYSKPSYIAKQNQLQSRTEKSFRQKGKRFTSPYAKQRTGASKLNKASQSRPSSGSFRKASTYRGASSSSSRRSSSRTSRGPRRGK